MGKKRAANVSDDEIVAAYERLRSQYKVGKELGIGATTVARVLYARGIKLDGLTRWRQEAGLYKGVEVKIRAAYENGSTYDQLRQYFGEGSDWSLKAAIRKAGGVLRENPAPLVKVGEVEKIKALHKSGMGQVAISLEIGRSQSFVSRIMRKHGIAPHDARGAKHSMWKGGRVRDTNGYIRLWIPEDDPLKCMSLNDGYVLEHRYAVGKFLGRPLRKSETVHHINGDRTDNRIENLQLRHGKHGKGVRLRCRCCGSTDIETIKID